MCIYMPKVGLWVRSWATLGVMLTCPEIKPGSFTAYRMMKHAQGLVLSLTWGLHLPGSCQTSPGWYAVCLVMTHFEERSRNHHQGKIQWHLTFKVYILRIILWEQLPNRVHMMLSRFSWTSRHIAWSHVHNDSFAMNLMHILGCVRLLSTLTGLAARILESFLTPHCSS